MLFSLNKFLGALVIFLSIGVFTYDYFENDTFLVFENNPSLVNKLVYESLEEHLEIALKDNKWKIKNQNDYLLHDEKINLFIKDLLSLTFFDKSDVSNEIIEESFEESFEENNTYLKVILSENEISKRVNFGSYIPYLEGRYLEKDNQYFLVKEADFQKLNLSKNLIIKKTNIMTYANLDFSSIVYFNSETKNAKLEIKKEADKWIVNLKNGDEPFIKDLIVKFLSLNIDFPEKLKVNCDKAVSISELSIEDNKKEVKVRISKPKEKTNEYLCLNLSNFKNTLLLRAKDYFKLRFVEEYLIAG